MDFYVINAFLIVVLVVVPHAWIKCPKERVRVKHRDYIRKIMVVGQFSLVQLADPARGAS